MEEGYTYNVLLITTLMFYLYPFEFLFSVYERLKSVTSEVVLPMDETWQGNKLFKIKYNFVFGMPNLRATPFKLDFMDGNPLYFSLVVS